MEDVEDESPGAISALVVSSEPDTARRSLGGPSPLLPDEADVEADDELLDALLVEELVELSSELDDARRSLGRSGSLSLEELLAELLPELLSSELEPARRSVGWLLLPDEPLLDELLAELLEELPDALRPSGCDVSSTANDAAECSSAVPTLTMLIEAAW